MSIIKSFLTIITRSRLDAITIDIKTAYLWGAVKGQVFMKQTEGYKEFGANGEELICKLNHSIYGLPTLMLSFYKRIGGIFDNLQMSSLDSATTVYAGIKDGDLLLYPSYSDDGILAGSKLMLIPAFLAEFSEHVNFEACSKLDGAVFDGLEIVYKQDQGLVFIHQTALMMKASSLSNGVHYSNQIEMDLDTFSSWTQDLQEQRQNDLEGRLPKSCRVSLVDYEHSRRYRFCDWHFRLFLIKPRKGGLGGASLSYRYLAGTIGYGLVLGERSLVPPIFKIFINSDYADDANMRKSMVGIVCSLFGSSVVSISKCMKNIVTSTYEAEYNVITKGCKEAIWFQQLLQDYDLGIPIPTPLQSDNQSTISNILESKYSEATQHLDMFCKFTRQQQNLELSISVTLLWRRIELISLPKDWMLLHIEKW